METLCANLSSFSGGQYIPKLVKDKNGYVIHDENMIIMDSDTSPKRIFTRNCQLYRADNVEIEIVLAPSLFTTDRRSVEIIIVLGCLNRKCEYETSVIIFEFVKKYRPQNTSTYEEG